ncbi:hypothetical protein [Actinomadura macrotermitis]|uniref:Uncharacterized protein n=1 Tax=Actinomadura macrotermitis TaxID=2585200 RepID=A0A7K0C3X2_9ACTN|nr:hypothetical protein [Actinomadura macrotermitis]MQY08135.1 hypothetical protein [Actinomadura macrotermitis]
MRRFAAVAITSGALIAGLTTTAAPAVAAPAPGPGVAAVTEQQGTIAKRSVLAQAEREGRPYSAKETAAIRRATVCRWYERTQGRKKSRHGRWLINVKNRLTWCYDGLHVVSYRANFSAYTYSKRVWKWRGWNKKRATHTGTWSSVTSEVEGRFYYTGNRRTYRPWITIMGAFDGRYHYWYGG